MNIDKLIDETESAIAKVYKGKDGQELKSMKVKTLLLRFLNDHLGEVIARQEKS